MVNNTSKYNSNNNNTKLSRTITLNSSKRNLHINTTSTTINPIVNTSNNHTNNHTNNSSNKTSIIINNTPTNLINTEDKLVLSCLDKSVDILEKIKRISSNIIINSNTSILTSPSNKVHNKYLSNINNTTNTPNTHNNFNYIHISWKQREEIMEEIVCYSAKRITSYKCSFGKVLKELKEVSKLMNPNYPSNISNLLDVDSNLNLFGSTIYNIASVSNTPKSSIDHDTSFGSYGSFTGTSSGSVNNLNNVKKQVNNKNSSKNTNNRYDNGNSNNNVVIVHKITPNISPSNKLRGINNNISNNNVSRAIHKSKSFSSINNLISSNNLISNTHNNNNSQELINTNMNKYNQQHQNSSTVNLNPSNNTNNCININDNLNTNNTPNNILIYKKPIKSTPSNTINNSTNNPTNTNTTNSIPQLKRKKKYKSSTAQINVLSKLKTDLGIITEEKEDSSLTSSRMISRRESNNNEEVNVDNFDKDFDSSYENKSISIRNANVNMPHETNYNNNFGKFNILELPNNNNNNNNNNANNKSNNLLNIELFNKEFQKQLNNSNKIKNINIKELNKISSSNGNNCINNNSTNNPNIYTNTNTTNTTNKPKNKLTRNKGNNTNNTNNTTNTSHTLKKKKKPPKILYTHEDVLDTESLFICPKNKKKNNELIPNTSTSIPLLSNKNSTTTASKVNSTKATDGDLNDLNFDIEDFDYFNNRRKKGNNSKLKIKNIMNIPNNTKAIQSNSCSSDESESSIINFILSDSAIISLQQINSNNNGDNPNKTTIDGNDKGNTNNNNVNVSKSASFSNNVIKRNMKNSIKKIPNSNTNNNTNKLRNSNDNNKCFIY